MGAGNASREDVSRLFARAAFGATEHDLDTWTGKPYDDVVEHLLDVPPIGLRAPASDEGTRLALEQATRAGNVHAASQTLGSLYVQEAQGWWLERMRTTPYPLEERLTLFWHDHWATAWRTDLPDIGMLVQQNQTLRRNALGTFPHLCEEMTLDPAMLYWLDGARNIAGAPNENFARELFELYTLGTMPQVFTETDVRQAARALTGWTVDARLRTPRFERDLHDRGTKRILGRTIADAGSREFAAVIDAALDQPVARRFLAFKLVQHFAFAPHPTNLFVDADPLIVDVAETLRRGWDIRAAMRTLLTHARFRQPPTAAGLQTVRTPIDLVVGVCRALGIPAARPEVITLLRRLRHLPFEPPQVDGWIVGRDWLTPLSAIARYEVGLALASIALELGVELPDPRTPAPWAARLGVPGWTANTDAALRAYVQARSDASDDELIAGMVALAVSSPDWAVA